MNTEPHTPDRELAELLEAALTDSLTAAQTERLRHRLRTEPAARAAYLQTQELEALLHFEFPHAASAAESTAAAATLRYDETTAHRPASRRSAFAPLGALFAIAASLALAFFVFHGNAPSASEPAPDPASPPTVARITKVYSTAAGAHGSPTAPAAGTPLAAGPLSSENARLEITLDSGVVLIAEPRTRLEIESPMRVLLHAGNITATVPPRAQGFIVNTPNSIIKDLGTIFGLSVNGPDSTQLHVLKGEVEASPATTPQSAYTLLKTSEAILISNGRIQPTPFSPELFSAALPGPEYTNINHILHWSFDELTPDHQFLDSTHGPALKLKFLEEPHPAPATLRVPAVFGTGLQLNGKGEQAYTPNYRGISGSGPRTIACWINLPPDSDPANPNGILSWGRFGLGSKWQACWNTQPNQGTLGALRLEYGQGYVIGSTDLRDGRWHHIAIVFLGGAESDVSTHVKLYVDGRLETQSGRLRQRIDTLTTETYSVLLTIGRYIGWRPEKSPPAFLRGTIDEAYVIDGALTPRQIWQLIETNTLAP